MAVSPTLNEKPRRTVNLGPPDKQCRRETHVTVPSLIQAWPVPAHPWRMVGDAWGRHGSALIPEEDRHSPTLIM